ncbi:hypothetical protein FS749_003236, partial [Ceratobasidium sp. UAMH 11750]
FRLDVFVESASRHKAADNAEVEDLLRPQALVPTENALSKPLLPFKFNFFSYKTPPTHLSDI